MALLHPASDGHSLPPSSSRPRFPPRRTPPHSAAPQVLPTSVLGNEASGMLMQDVAMATQSRGNRYYEGPNHRGHSG